jgi:NAD(P)-dependent dehydrogenase (short-subunit alcohol dehydrogenase family)
MEGKVALVTGASSGIGRATARRLADEGARVTVAARRADRLEALVTDIAAAGGEAIAVETDVADRWSVDHSVAQTLEAFGQLDVAVNNAASIGPIGPIAELSDEDWRQLMAVNVDGVFYCMRAQIAAMRESGGGSIVNVGSVNSFLGAPMAAPYVTSKHAILGLTRSAGAELASENIRVNIVCPGLVQTEMQEMIADIVTDGDPDGFENPFLARTPQGRLSNPIEIAHTILWLASDEASFVTGTALTVDGGVMAG